MSKQATTNSARIWSAAAHANARFECSSRIAHKYTSPSPQVKYVMSDAHTASSRPWSNCRFTRSGGIIADRLGMVVQTLNDRGLIPAMP